jgi:hypothetical protein
MSQPRHFGAGFVFPARSTPSPRIVVAGAEEGASPHCAIALTGVNFQALAYKDALIHTGSHPSLRSRMPDLLPPVSPYVVIVEADPDNRQMYALFLESRGARVHVAATAAGALAHLRDGSPADALVFDAVNLGMTVQAFCNAVRKNGNGLPGGSSS